MEQNSPFPVGAEIEPSRACTAVKELACTFRVEILLWLVLTEDTVCKPGKKKLNRKITERSGSKTSTSLTQVLQCMCRHGSF